LSFWCSGLAQLPEQQKQDKGGSGSTVLKAGSEWEQPPILVAAGTENGSSVA